MSASTSTAPLLRFDFFELDLHTGELRKGSLRLRLQGQPIQLLAILLKNAGHLVTRDELRKQLWPADTFVDFDHGLNNAILRIREALGDSAETPRYIETLPRRGYKFITPVEEVLPQGSEHLAQSKMPAAPSTRKPGARARAILVPLLTVVAIGLALWLIPAISHHTSAAPIHSIAVLPLENLSGDPSQNYFVDGMTDELITNLATASSLRVISRTSVMRYKDTKKSLPEIARELDVDSIVEGSVMRSGGRVRITAQLIRANTDEHIWAATYERDLGDVFRLQGEVAEAIAQHVRAELTPERQASLRSRPAVNPEAYEFYLRGRYAIDTNFTTASGLNAAKDYFEESIRKDPNFALAYVGLANSYVYLALFRQMSPEFAYRPAEEALRKALQLDDSIGEAHDTLALLKWRFDWDWPGAEREFESAFALSPSYDCAHADHSTYLSLIGRRAEALAEITRSRELNPGSSFDSTESADFYLLRDFKALIEASQKGIAADPNDWLEHFYLGAGYEGSGRPTDAIPEYQRAVELSGGDQDPTAALAHAYAVTGRRSDAEKILQDLLEKSKSAYVSPYMIATIYAGLGDKKHAFEFLEQAYQEKSLEIPWALKSDLRLDNLRSDPQFQSLMQRVHFPRESHVQS